MSEQNEYEIERSGNLEYVIVRCPHGHFSRGMKVGETKLRLGLTCCHAALNSRNRAPLFSTFVRVFTALSLQ